MGRYEGVFESTVRRFRLIAAIAVEASRRYWRLPTDSFWAAMAYAMMGGPLLATLFVPALCAACFGVRLPAVTPPLSGEASPCHPVPIARN